MTVVKIGVNSGDSTGCFEIKVWADTFKFTNMRIARFRKSGYLVIEVETFVEDET